MYVHLPMEVRRGFKTPLELELQLVGGGLGNKLEPFGRAISTLNCQAISPSPSS